MKPTTPLATERRTLETALRRLNKAGGPVAKRNARAAVLKALRSLRAAVDKSYPVERRKPARKRKRRSPYQRLRETIMNPKWQQVPNGLLPTITNAGIRVRLRANAGQRGMPVWTFAPSWAVQIAKHRPARLREAKRSPTVRKALLTEIELLGS